MKITYNNPERCKEREKVVPPTMEDINIALKGYSDLFKSLQFIDNPACNEIIRQYRNMPVETVLQLLLDHHQNLQHFYDVVGGWDKYSEVINHYGALYDFITNLHESNVIQQSVEDILK